jgi:hypothetical protein
VQPWSSSPSITGRRAAILRQSHHRGGQINNEGVSMGLDDMVNQAKDMIKGTPSAAEKVEGAVDQAADAVQEKTPDQVDGAVEQASQAVKDQI